MNRILCEIGNVIRKYTICSTIVVFSLIALFLLPFVPMEIDYESLKYE